MLYCPPLLVSHHVQLLYPFFFRPANHLCCIQGLPYRTPINICSGINNLLHHAPIVAVSRTYVHARPGLRCVPSWADPRGARATRCLGDAACRRCADVSCRGTNCVRNSLPGGGATDAYMRRARPQRPQAIWNCGMACQSLSVSCGSERKAGSRAALKLQIAVHSFFPADEERASAAGLRGLRRGKG